MTKLTDAQLIVLSQAAARDDGGGIVPPKMNKAAAAKVGSSLVARKLMREVRAKPGMPTWREENGRKFSLIITRAGRDAVGVNDDRSEPARRSFDEDAGAGAPAAGAAPRPGSKQALIVTMLSKHEGASLNALIEATGWLPHTTRAALTGLRKRGFVVERSADEIGGSLYRITRAQKLSARA